MRNQTVLLRGVNDDPAVLGELLAALTAHRMPAVLHFPVPSRDRRENMFQVPMEQGIEIVENAKRLVSGMDKAVKYCLSHPAGKLEILTKTGEDELLFRFHEAKDPARCGQVFRHRTAPRTAAGCRTS